MSTIICYTFTLISFILLQVTLISADLDCNGPNLQKHTAKSTAYYPSPSQGGTTDCRGNKLNTLGLFTAYQADYVSVAMAPDLKIPYGTSVCIPELNHKYGREIDFRVVDTVEAFNGAGFSKINICVNNAQDAGDPSVNGQLTIYFSNLQTGFNYCG